MQKYTTIRITPDTRDKIASAGRKNETYDDVLARYFGKNKEVS